MPNETDIFLCYRRSGAQTAKLFKKYALKQNYPYAIWYSDWESFGNYKTDIPQLISQAECAVIFFSSDFTNHFLDENGKVNRTDNTSAETPWECITVTEIIEIERKRQSDPDFRIIAVNLDDYTLTEADGRILQSVFSQSGILKPDSISAYLHINTNFFRPARDDEDVLAQKIMHKILPNVYFRHKRHTGDFWFGNRKTSVDLIYNGFYKPINTSDIHFELSSADIPEYDQINNKRKHFSQDSQNDDMISVTAVSSQLSDNTENLHVTIEYKLIKYNLFRKTVELLKAGDSGLHGEIDKYNSERDCFKLPNAMGLAFMVISSDNYFVFSQRSLQRNIRSGEPDCSIVEGLKPEVKQGGIVEYDIDADDFIGKEIRRGFQEEICSEWREDNIVTVHGITFDKDYAQWNIFGVIQTSLTVAEIERAHPKRHDSYEKNRLIPVEFYSNNSQKLRQALAGFLDEGMWDTALAVLYGALASMGIADVDGYIRNELLV